MGRAIETAPPHMTPEKSRLWDLFVLTQPTTFRDFGGRQLLCQ